MVLMQTRDSVRINDNSLDNVLPVMVETNRLSDTVNIFNHSRHLYISGAERAETSTNLF